MSSSVESTRQPISVFAPFVAAYRWVNQRGYAQGVFWAIMVCLVSSLNDVLTRYSGNRMDFLQVAFFRFFFSTLTLLPVMLYFDRSSFKTKRPLFHCLRSLLGYGAVVAWVAGVSMTTLSIASIMAQTVGLFVLIMASAILHERVGWQRAMATTAGMLGIIIILAAPKGDVSLGLTSLQMFDLGASVSSFFSHSNIGVLFLLIAAVLFAASDILNKVMIAKESSMTMLFYFAFGTMTIGLIPALYVWQTPQAIELFWLLCLGAGANLILFCLLKAFSATDISALQPYRYVEIFFATGFGIHSVRRNPNHPDSGRCSNYCPKHVYHCYL